MPKKLTIEYIRRAFEAEGCVLLTNEYKNNKQLLEYICPNGHKHEINWGRFQQGKRCPYCNGSFLHYDEIKKEFDKRGFILLSKEYKHDVPLEYICPNGHKHSILYHNFKKGHGCPECDGQYIPFENIQKEFEKRGCTLISTQKDYKNTSSILKYKCENGHIHETCWANFRVSKIGCKREYVKIDFIEKYFNSKGCKLLTKEYKNNGQELEYICPKGKKHKTTWRRFFNKGQLCKCFKVYKGEEEISKILKENNIEFKEQYGFKECRYKYPLKFDFYLPKYNTCIEYDGEGHYDLINFGGKDEEELIKMFKEGQKRDEIKNQYCKDNNIKLIRIPYWEFKNIKNILKEHLKF